MTTPYKPWAGKDFNMNQFAGDAEPSFGLSSQSGDVPSVGGVVGSGVRPLITAPGPGTSSLPPPIPSRAHQTALSSQIATNYSQPYSRYNMNSYSSYGFGGGYPYSSYGTGYGGYGAYPRRMMGAYGMGYSGYGGYQEDFDASMMQAIDESCQSLFGPFDGLVRSISSIAMVMESTHQAMQFSFRTVLSAADSLSKLKNMLIQMITSVSLLRLLKSLYYKVLRLLGLVSGSKLKEKEWSEVFSQVSCGPGGEVSSPSDRRPSPWLAMGFFSLMMGAPYLMFKMFAQSNPRSQINNNGLSVGEDYFEAVAVYDFDGGSPQEMVMRRGDQVKVSKTHYNQSWALVTNGTSTGYVPSNRLQVVPSRSMNRRYGGIDQRNSQVQPLTRTVARNAAFTPEMTEMPVASAVPSSDSVPHEHVEGTSKQA